MPQGTVKDVRPPTFIPEDYIKILEDHEQLRPPQDGILVDNDSGESKNFMSNCSRKLQIDDIVEYKELTNNPNYNAIVIC